MARRSRAPSFSESSASEDEEKAVGRTPSSRRSKKSSSSGKRSSKSTKPTIYRSLPTNAGSNKKGAAAAPSDSETDHSQATASDAPTASASDSEGATKERKEPKNAPVATKRPQGGQQEEEKKSNTIWYIIGGVVIVVIIAAGLGFYFYNKNSTTSTDDASAQNSTSTSNLTSPSAGSLPIATPSATPTEATSTPLVATSTMNSTDSSSNATATATGMGVISTGEGKSNLTMGVDDEGVTGSDASDPGTMTGGATGTPWVPSLTADAPQSTQMSAGNPSETQKTRATFFVSDNGVTPCLSRPNDGDFVVHVSPKFYGDLAKVSPRCGAWISMWNEATDYTVSATIEGVCANCEDYQIDLSQAAFFGLTTDMKLGQIDKVQWWFTPDQKKPKPSLSSYTKGSTKTPKHKEPAKTNEVMIETARARVRL